jgi:hypothetical protein
MVGWLAGWLVGYLTILRTRLKYVYNSQLQAKSRNIPAMHLHISARQTINRKLLAVPASEHREVCNVQRTVQAACCTCQ